MQDQSTINRVAGARKHGVWSPTCQRSAPHAVAAAFLLTLSISQLFVPPVLGGERLGFKRARLFDGEHVRDPANVVVHDGLIESVGPDVTIPDDAQVIDAEGMTLLPGLIDCHTHTFVAAQLEQAVVFGVTTQLDMFSAHAFAGQMREEQRTNQAAGRADLFSAGTLVTAAKGHGTQFGLTIPTLDRADAAQEFVDERIKEGSDYIKLVYDDGRVWGRELPTLSRDVINAVVRAAHARNKLALVHVATQAAAREALDAGVDGLVHVFIDQPADDELVRRAIERRVFVVPTLTVLEGTAGTPSGRSLTDDKDLAPFLAPAEARNLNAGFPRGEGMTCDFAAALKSVGKLYRAGVPILAGTDAPNPGTTFGASVHRELELLVAAGLSPSAALAGATSLGAERFRLADRGRIAPGLRADLVLVAGDPTTDILATRKIVGVWKQGRRVDREAVRRRVAEETARLASDRNAPPSDGLKAGLVSDFDGEKVTAAFGAGWATSTDSFVGGKSKAEFKLTAGGAGESAGALAITGTIEDRPQPRWAGVMFSPGKVPFQPADLSTKKAISFWAKGDGKTYTVLLFYAGRGFRPSAKSFTSTDEWQRHTLRISDFDGCDGSDIMGLFFGGGESAGPFELLIDEVKFE